MNRTELTAALAQKIALPKTQTKAILDALEETVKAELENGGNVNLLGFGTFAVKEVKQREARNPATGKKITIKAHKKPVFTFSKAYAKKF
ncbi:MAG: HU family DNA-binding protein [Clostridia bacterium]|nr:HU family DNA-binding protein [Clostridia bacterium]